MRGILVLGLLLVLVAAAAAQTVDGIPTSQKGSITVSSSAVGFPATACRETATAGAPEHAALAQNGAASIYVTFNSATGTPTSADFLVTPYQWFAIAKPSLFRAIRVSGDSALAYQCIAR